MGVLHTDIRLFRVRLGVDASGRACGDFWDVLAARRPAAHGSGCRNPFFHSKEMTEATLRPLRSEMEKLKARTIRLEPGHGPLSRRRGGRRAAAARRWGCEKRVR